MRRISSSTVFQSGTGRARAAARVGGGGNRRRSRLSSSRSAGSGQATYTNNIKSDVSFRESAIVCDAVEQFIGNLPISPNAIPLDPDHSEIHDVYLLCYATRKEIPDMATISTKEESPPPATRAVNLRVREDVRDLIDRAARVNGKTRSDFMIEAARQAAENALMDQAFVQVDAETYAQFLSVLDRPPSGEGYERLLRAPKPWTG